MEQKDKELLLKDLCARLPYGVIVNYNGIDDYTLSIKLLSTHYVEKMKPYLRPMSSMTEEEKKEYDHRLECMFYDTMYDDAFAIDWLNTNHFDYRGLIEKGLAISTDDFNPYKD